MSQGIVAIALRLAAPSISWAGLSAANRSKDVGLRNREENEVLLERCDSADIKFGRTHKVLPNALVHFGIDWNAESTPGNRSMPGVLELPATKRSPGAAWTVARTTRWLPGHQIWGQASKHAGSFVTALGSGNSSTNDLSIGIVDYRQGP